VDNKQKTPVSQEHSLGFAKSAFFLRGLDSSGWATRMGGLSSSLMKVSKLGNGRGKAE